MKNKLIIAGGLLLPLITLAVFLLVRKTLTAKNQQNPQLIGGQKDEHGCLIPAGYSWCEPKQKCLREWEEPCAKPATSNTLDWLTYTNSENGFQISLPNTWAGYTATSGEHADFSQVSFSFVQDHQPFSLIQILIYSPQQWEKAPDTIKSLKVLSDQGDRIYVCDGCCGLDENYTGGGQFDLFQQERCKEGAQIVETFGLLK